MDNKKTFGTYILQRRRELGMTQHELAEKLYVTESAVSKWERGLSYPDITLLMSICGVLDISEHELLTGSEDTQKRASEQLASKYLRLTRSYRIIQYIVYGLALLGCAIGNLAARHTLDWFFIVLASVLAASSLTLAPALADMHPKLERCKAAVSLGCFTFSLELLLLVCCLYTGGKWFAAAAAGVVFGLSFFILPVLLYQFPLTQALKRHKTLLYFSVQTILLLLLLLVTVDPRDFLRFAIPIALLCLTLPWGVMAAIRYLPINGWLRACVCAAWTELWVWLAPFGVDRILGVSGDPASVWSVWTEFDFSRWGGWYTERNVFAIILFSLAAVVLLLAVAGIIRAIRSRRREQ